MQTDGKTFKAFWGDDNPIWDGSTWVEDSVISVNGVDLDDVYANSILDGDIVDIKDGFVCSNDREKGDQPLKKVFSQWLKKES